MKKLSFLTFTLFIFLLNLGTHSYAVTPVSSVTSSMKSDAENAIKTCEAKYLDVKTLGAKIDAIPKPSFLNMSSSAKKAYNNKESYKKAFETQFQEFTKFTNNKIDIRINYTSDEANIIEKFPSQVATYTANCNTYTTNLTKFVEWALSGETKNKEREMKFKIWLQ